MLPEYLVLDTRRIMRLFRQHVKQFKKPSEIPDDLVQELLECFRTLPRAEDRFDNMISDMLGQQFQYDQGSVDEDYNNLVDAGIVSFLLELGDIIKEQLQDVRAFDNEGKLMYTYHPTPAEGCNDVVLRRKDASQQATRPVGQRLSHPAHLGHSRWTA